LWFASNRGCVPHSRKKPSELTSNPITSQIRVPFDPVRASVSPNTWACAAVAGEVTVDSEHAEAVFDVSVC